MKKLFWMILFISNAFLFGQTIQVTSPNGGERLQQGTQNTISWTSSGTAVNVIIEASIDNGATWPINIATRPANEGSYQWDFSLTPSTQCLIRISDSAVPADFDVSDNPFTVVSLSLTTPNGGEHWQIGKNYNILWAQSGLSNVKLEYTTNNGTSWTAIVSSINAALGTYQWTVPNIPSTGCKIRVSDVTNSLISDVSSASFTITGLTLTSPNGGENFLEGSTQSITWISSNVTNVRLEYSINGGAYNLIPGANSLAATSGNFNWTVPVGTSTNCLIRILDADYLSVNDESNFAFTISNLTLTAPAGGAIWQGGTNQNITWTSTNITNVKIDYSTDNGATWLSVINSTPAAAGTYSWSVPNTPSLQSKIRVSDLSYQSNFVVSNVFTIEPIPAINVMSANGFENWQENSVHNITWTATYNIANVNIEFSSNNGTSWSSIANNIQASLGTYSWTVPNSYSQNCRIRISNSVNAAVNDVSDNTFTISSLVLTSPNGGEKYQVGKNYNITWTSINISNVKLEYSTNNGTSWTTIISSVSSTPASYSWTIPNTVSTNCIVRTSDASNSDIKDQSNAIFTIASVTLTSPNGSESWIEGSTHAVTWNSANIANVRLEYSTDGTAWNNIVASTAAAAGTYNWTVPSVSASTYRVRISDASDANVNDLSDNLFTISQISLISPIGNEDWKVGTAHDINWSVSSTIVNVKLEYTTNNGSSWNTIAASVVASLGTYRWIVPNTTSINCKVRISSVASPEVNSVSTAFFTISKSLIVKTPNGGETWEVGSIRNITWERDPSINFIRVQYSTNPAANIWNDINSYVDASLGTYSWTIPNTLSSNCLVRISDIDNVTNIDSSDAKFTIQSTPSIVITRPNGGESFETGAQELITWTSNNVTTVKLEYSIDNGAKWNLIKSAQPSTGSYLWSVPNLSSNQCKIRITDENNSNVFDLSDNKFTIIPRIVLTNPNGGNQIYVGSNFNITWTSTNVANVDLYYSVDNGTNWTQINTSTINAAAGTYTWMNIPNNPSSYCLIRISDSSAPGILDISDNVFSIINKIKLISPNGNESWQSGSSQKIEWQSTSVTNVSLAYSTNNGISWTSIATSVSATTGFYNWTIPTITSNQIKVRVSDSVNPNVFDISDLFFTISSIDLKTPNGSENYTIGSMQTITWASNLISKIKLEYSIDNGLNWILIEDNVTSSGIYYWQVPNTSSTQCRVRISETGNPSTYDISTNVFSIVETPAVKIIYPNGGESIGVGKTEVIKWSSNNVSNVKLEYSINAGTSWTTIATSSASTGNYNWTVPNINSTLCKIRVSDTARPGLSDVSDSVFTITSAPNLKITSPNGNEVWRAGTMQSILWTSTNVDGVNLEYSINNGVSWKTIKNNVPSTGVYIWHVPSEASYQCRVRVSDVSNAEIMDAGDVQFTIAILDLLTPHDGEILLSGSPYNITWNSASISNVKLEFTTNDGTNWTNINANLNALLGSYAWTLPSGNIQQGRIRISDVSKPAVFDLNESGFVVKQIIVVSPIDYAALKIGTTQTIQWQTYNIANVKIEFSTDGGVIWETIVPTMPANVGYYNWIVPNSPSEYCSIKISDANNLSTFATNENYFAINFTGTDVNTDYDIPTKYDLFQNYPNPFNPETIIRYQIPNRGFVDLTVYNLLGEEISKLVYEEKSAGTYQIVFNGKHLPSGIYIYRIQTGNYISAKKLILVK